MAEIVLTAQTPFRITVEGTVDTSGSGEVVANLVAAAPGAALLVANNLSDVASAATARTNLAASALASPTFTGVPAAPTAAPATSTTQIATTAFVTTADNLKANLASPTFTGVPAAPTAAPATNTTQIATTEFVTTADALKANLASPTFTGTPAAPTAAVDVSTTQIATTAFVAQENLRTPFVMNATVQVAATTAGVTYLPNPAMGAGNITRIRSGNSADPGGNLVFTTAIGPSGGPFVAITNGTFTIANASGPGSLDSATPTANNTLGNGSMIEIAWDNGAANAINVGITIEITRAV